jgi:alkylation response protein AidB-like acyl-CoA dehydrogenase
MPEIDAHLSDEHRAVRDLAREFTAGEIAPHAERWNAEHHVPIDVLRKLGELGLLGITVPEELGGAGLDQTAVALVVQEIARADVGTSTAVAVQNGLGSSPIRVHGTEAQKERFLPDVATGRRFAAYALTEPDAGSDAGSLRTTATARDGEFLLSGSKTWISNGGFAEVFIVFARTGGPGPRGISAFIVEKGGEGFTIGREIPKMGLHTSSTVELAFDGHRVAADRMLGAEGAGMGIALQTLDAGRITIASQACGIARAAFDIAS